MNFFPHYMWAENEKVEIWQNLYYKYWMKNPQNHFLISWKFHFCTTNTIIWILPSNWRHFEVHFFLISRKHILVVAKANFPQFLKNTKFPVWRRNVELKKRKTDYDFPPPLNVGGKQ